MGWFVEQRLAPDFGPPVDDLPRLAGVLPIRGWSPLDGVPFMDSEPFLRSCGDAIVGLYIRYDGHHHVQVALDRRLLWEGTTLRDASEGGSAENHVLRTATYHALTYAVRARLLPYGRLDAGGRREMAIADCENEARRMLGLHTDKGGW